MPNIFGPGHPGDLTTDDAGNLNVATSTPVDTADIRVDQYLSVNGDGTGAIDGTANYSGTAQAFYIQPDSDENYSLERMIVTIEDGQGFRAEWYGALGAELTNGISVQVVSNAGTLATLTDEQPIKTNTGWGSYCYDATLKTWGAGDEVVLVRWTFSRDGGPILLRGSINERLEVVLNDNFTGLIKHRFIVKGKRVVI